ncbi:OB-fold domain-containing protein [Nocardia sp. NPDC003963]
MSRSFVPGYQEIVPYVIGWIGLVEQPSLRVLSTIPGDAEVRIGAPVRVSFEHVAGFGAVPVFLLT